MVNGYTMLNRRMYNMDAGHKLNVHNMEQLTVHAQGERQRDRETVTILLTFESQRFQGLTESISL